MDKDGSELVDGARLSDGEWEGANDGILDGSSVGLCEGSDVDGAKLDA